MTLAVVQGCERALPAISLPGWIAGLLDEMTAGAC